MMYRISHYPEFLSERLSAVEDIGRTWIATAVIVAALAFGMSLIQ
ncbi:hypothetical protein [Dongia deserti]|nr:hypothetical protein [Dongia deserti]